MPNLRETNNGLVGRTPEMNGYAPLNGASALSAEDYYSAGVLVDWIESQAPREEESQLHELVETALIKRTQPSYRSEWICRPTSARPARKPRAKK